MSENITIKPKDLIKYAKTYGIVVEVLPDKGLVKAFWQDSLKIEDLPIKEIGWINGRDLK